MNKDQETKVEVKNLKSKHYSSPTKPTFPNCVNREEDNRTRRDQILRSYKDEPRERDSEE